MSLLARFKKPGGTEKLIALLESSDQKVRENILKNIRSEDPEFTASVEEKLFFWPDVFGLPDMVVADIVSEVPPKTLALALSYLEEDKKQFLMTKMNHQTQSKIREEIDVLGAEPNKNLVATSRRKVIETARELERDGRITLKNAGKAAAVLPAAAAGKLPEITKPGTPEDEAVYKNLKEKWGKAFNS